MKRIEAFNSEINRLCKIYNVKKLYVFGSVLTDKYNPESDINLIVDFADVPLEDYTDNYFDFKFSLQDIFDMSANPRLAKYIRTYSNTIKIYAQKIRFI